jgi:hypothetical protein
MTNDRLSWADSSPTSEFSRKHSARVH